MVYLVHGAHYCTGCLCVLQVPDLPEEDPDVRGGGQAYEDRAYRGDTEEQVWAVCYNVCWLTPLPIMTSPAAL
jgi:hypothetical protein